MYRQTICLAILIAPILLAHSQESDVSVFQGVSVVPMDGREHPENGQRTGQGHSIGWFEGDVLVVDTTLLQNHPWGNGDGLPSGGQKRVVERYSLSDDGTRITIEAIAEDPEYLAEAVSTVYEWGYTPDVAFIPDTGCDPEVSRYHLQ
jgi:hypothetical protein